MRGYFKFDGAIEARRGDMGDCGVPSMRGVKRTWKDEISSVFLRIARKRVDATILRKKDLPSGIVWSVEECRGFVIDDDGGEFGDVVAREWFERSKGKNFPVFRPKFMRSLLNFFHRFHEGREDKIGGESFLLGACSRVLFEGHRR